MVPENDKDTSYSRYYYGTTVNSSNIRKGIFSNLTKVVMENCLESSNFKPGQCPYPKNT